MCNEQELLNKYKNLILNSSAFKGLKIIGITGSIGRGEKSIVDENLNDIDFFVIANSCNLYRKLAIENKLKKLTNTHFTDILFLKTRKFKKNLRANLIDQYLLDLITGSRLLYGRDDFVKIFESAKEIKYEVSHQSAIAILLTRLWCLTGPYSIRKSKIVPFKEEFTFYQMRKAIGAIIDAILIHEKLYCSPYLELKMENFLTSRFYKENKMSTDLLLEFYSGKIEDFERIYNILITMYLLAIDQIIGKDINSYLSFPLKKTLFLSVIRKNQRKNIKQIIKRYNTLKLVHQFFIEKGERSILNELSLLFREIYAELME